MQLLAVLAGIVIIWIIISNILGFIASCVSAYMQIIDSIFEIFFSTVGSFFKLAAFATGVLFLIVAYDDYQNRNSFFTTLFNSFSYKSTFALIGVGLSLIGITVFGGWDSIFDALILIVVLGFIILIFYIFWDINNDDDSILKKVAVSSLLTSIAVVLISGASHIFSYMPFIPFLGFEAKVASTVGKTAVNAGEKVVANVGKAAVNAGEKVAANVGKAAVNAGEKVAANVGKAAVNAGEKVAANVGKTAVNAGEKVAATSVIDKATSEMGWSSVIAKRIRSEAEYNIYKNAGLTEKVINEKICLIKKIDWTQKDNFGRTNIERARSGIAPLDKNNKPLELHHVGQKMDSPLAELTMDEHRGKEHDSILHDKTIDTEIDRGEFDKERIKHWQKRAEDAGG